MEVLKMFYYDLMQKNFNRLQELSKRNFPKYKNMSTGELTEEYTEQEKLINQYNQLQEYERAINPSFCHNGLDISYRLNCILDSL
jgi:hypothetical protein